MGNSPSFALPPSGSLLSVSESDSSPLHSNFATPPTSSHEALPPPSSKLTTSSTPVNPNTKSRPKPVENPLASVLAQETPGRPSSTEFPPRPISSNPAPAPAPAPALENQYYFNPTPSFPHNGTPALKKPTKTTFHNPVSLLPSSARPSQIQPSPAAPFPRTPASIQQGNHQALGSTPSSGLRKRRKSTSTPAADKSPEQKKHKTRRDKGNGDSNLLKYLLILAAVVGVAILGYYLLPILASFIPSYLPYCSGTEGPDTPCTPCPSNAVCHPNSNTFECINGYVLSKDKTRCVQDTEIYNRAEKAILNHLKPLLQRRKGDFECGYQPTVYIENSVIRTFLLDKTKDNNFELLFQEVLNIVNNHHIYHDEPGFYTTAPAKKTIYCQIVTFFQTYKWLLLFIVVGSISAACFVQRKKKVDEIVTTIRSRLQESKDQDDCGIPIAKLKQDAVGESPSFLANIVWKGVESAIQHDKAIAKTLQLLDGEQVETWQILPEDY